MTISARHREHYVAQHHDRFHQHHDKKLQKKKHLTHPLGVQNPQEPHISFSPAIHPDNILAQAMGEEFVHTEDNIVEYYEAHKEGGRTK